jgi:hypothetical protein
MLFGEGDFFATRRTSMLFQLFFLRFSHKIRCLFMKRAGFGSYFLLSLHIITWVSDFCVPSRHNRPLASKFSSHRSDFLIYVHCIKFSYFHEIIIQHDHTFISPANKVISLKPLHQLASINYTSVSNKLLDSELRLWCSWKLRHTVW